MGKKKFTGGLDSLFDTPKYQENVDHYQETEQVTTATAVPSTAPKRANSKNFTADLDSLFDEVVKENIIEKVKKEIGLQDIKTIRQSGIDSLIRNTTGGPEEHNADPDLAPVKRVTFIFDNKKLEKLKNIAKHEQAYIKDIINSIISSYIDDYERSKGNLT